jgi:fructose-1,6-bisphosphatase
MSVCDDTFEPTHVTRIFTITEGYVIQVFNVKLEAISLTSSSTQTFLFTSPDAVSVVVPYNNAGLMTKCIPYDEDAALETTDVTTSYYAGNTRALGDWGLTLGGSGYLIG